MPRARKQPIIKQKYLNLPKKYLRFSTPKEVAEYRAERLKCNLLLEIGSGIGGQTIAFAQKCKKIISIEIDKEKAKIAKKNFKKLGIKNVNLIIGDAMSQEVVEKIRSENPEIIFVDTERPEQAERTLENIRPPIKKIIDVYSKITSKIAIEIPPFTSIGNLKEKYFFEEEFISLNRQLNRLTLYFNELKTCNKSVIALPSKEKIIFSEKNIKPLEIKSPKGFEYLYSINPAIVLSGMVKEISEKFNFSVLQLNKPVLVSSEKKESNFLVPYKILKICENNKEKIIGELKKLNAGKIILRYNIKPENYWEERKNYESQLKGKKEFDIFINEQNNEAIICEKI